MLPRTAAAGSPALPQQIATPRPQVAEIQQTFNSRQTSAVEVTDNNDNALTAQKDYKPATLTFINESGDQVIKLTQSNICHAANKMTPELAKEFILAFYHHPEYRKLVPSCFALCYFLNHLDNEVGNSLLEKVISDNNEFTHMFPSIYSFENAISILDNNAQRHMIFLKATNDNEQLSRLIDSEYPLKYIIENFTPDETNIIIGKILHHSELFTRIFNPYYFLSFIKYIPENYWEPCVAQLIVSHELFLNIMRDPINLDCFFSYLPKIYHAELLANFALINKKSALHIAIEQLATAINESDIQKIESRILNLLMSGDDPNFKDGMNRTPISLLLPININSEITIYNLLKYGADANTKSHLTGDTLLSQWLLDLSPYLVFQLLESGADPTLINHKGQNCLDQLLTKAYKNKDFYLKLYLLIAYGTISHHKTCTTNENILQLTSHIMAEPFKEALLELGVPQSKFFDTQYVFSSVDMVAFRSMISIESIKARSTFLNLCLLRALSLKESSGWFPPFDIIFKVAQLMGIDKSRAECRALYDACETNKAEIRNMLSSPGGVNVLQQRNAGNQITMTFFKSAKIMCLQYYALERNLIKKQIHKNPRFDAVREKLAGAQKREASLTKTSKDRLKEFAQKSEVHACLQTQVSLFRKPAMQEAVIRSVQGAMLLKDLEQNKGLIK